ncbi:hypothetical protein CLU79DRAFT_838457 [Phycomyces nitens]|nr:hypothetical protein CLU79DRAFT_838457 [Phycomyces nitens]
MKNPETTPSKHSNCPNQFNIWLDKMNYARRNLHLTKTSYIPTMKPNTNSPSSESLPHLTTIQVDEVVSRPNEEIGNRDTSPLFLDEGADMGPQATIPPTTKEATSLRLAPPSSRPRRATIKTNNMSTHLTHSPATTTDNNISTPSSLTKTQEFLGFNPNTKTMKITVPDIKIRKLIQRIN